MNDLNQPAFCQTNVVGSTVILGDCIEVMKQYPDKHFDLAVVDPPYGLGESVVNSGGRFKRYHNKNGNWDLEIPTPEYFNELFRISKEQIIWGGNYFSLPANKCFIIWDKLQPEDISFAMAEYAWASFDKVAKICKQRTQGQEQRFHPTQKPIYLYDFIFKHFSEKGQRILDTHLGSGSSRIAADKAGLDFTGIEIDKEYFEASDKRFKQYKQQLRMEF
jgi:site-specific DNA-methyltransferase (adenine-specific)